jgi:hypothetical protein
MGFSSLRVSFVAACVGSILALSGSAALSAGRLYAEQITKANAATHIQKGPDASGGIGDWALSNGTLCVTLADLDHAGDLAASGGTLRDIGFCNRADDHYVSSQDLLNGSQSEPVHISDIQAVNDPQQASLVTRGGFMGLQVETQYSLDPKAPTRLKIKKRIWRDQDDAANPGLFASMAFNYHSMESFLLSTQHGARSNGFVQEKFVGRGTMALSDAARSVDTIIMLSAHDAEVPISYGWQVVSARRQNQDGSEPEALPVFALADKSALAFLTLVEPLMIGDGSKLGLLQLAQVPFLSLELGEEIHIEEHITVAPSFDVAAITDQLYPSAARLSGRIEAGPGQKSVLHLDRADGAPFTQISPQEDGQFSLRLPAGEYRLRVVSQGNPPHNQWVRIEQDDLTIEPVQLSPAARIALPQGEAMRLSFHGLGDTPNPDFADQLTGYAETGEDGLIAHRKAFNTHLAGKLGDPTHVYLRPGNYQVYAVRGPEFSVETTRLSVTNASPQNLAIATPKRVLQTPNFIAADLHVHSGPSFDNAFSTRKRVRSFVAEHGEVMVASEHDTIFDFNPLLKQMQLSDAMIAITGSEVTSTVNSARAPYSIGHINFFPLEPRPQLYQRGVVAHENRRTREVLYDMHRNFAAPFSQLNHARDSFALSGELPDDYQDKIDPESFFTHMGVAGHPFNPSQPLTSAPNNSLIEADPVTKFRDLDFDAMELMNGTQSYRPERTQALRADWHALLSQGERITGTANSDSHDTTQQVALPRNMVHSASDTLADFDTDAFMKSLRKGAFYGTTGPFLELDFSGAKMGDTYSGASGILKGRVYSADWVNVDTLEVQLNGRRLASLDIAPDGRFSIPITSPADAYLTLEVSGTAGDIYQAVYPGFFPYAYSNPIYIDADADGIWTPPGLGQ